MWRCSKTDDDGRHMNALTKTPRMLVRFACSGASAWVGFIIIIIIITGQETCRFEVDQSGRLWPHVSLLRGSVGFFPLLQTGSQMDVRDPLQAVSPAGHLSANCLLLVLSFEHKEFYGAAWKTIKSVHAAHREILQEGWLGRLSMYTETFALIITPWSPLMQREGL